MAVCDQCGEDNPGRARFCLACGSALEEPARPQDVRKTVTVLFCDVTESTPLGERVDAETLRRVMSRYHGTASTVLERHGASVEKFIGDAVMAVFGIPTVHDDDALRAVRAATEMREALRLLNEELARDFGVELAFRTGIASGEVVAGDPSGRQAFATGRPVVLAERLERSAAPGEILIADATQRLVRNAVLAEPLEPLELKGMAERVPAWRLQSVLDGAEPFARRLDSELVGRDRERTLLEQAFRRAVDERTCHLFTVLGPAGVGKSRLAGALLAAVASDARVLTGRCLAYGDAITFWPLTEVVKQAAGITLDLSGEQARERIDELLAGEPEARLIAERIVASIGIAATPASADETFWAARRFVEALARRRPLVVVFDDVHWAAPLFLDLVEQLADWTREAPVLLVCLARPDLLEDHPGWAGGKLNATSLLLEPLNADDADRLIENLLAPARLAEDVRRRIARAGENNPLFIEEMVAELVEDEALKRCDGRWLVRGDLETIAVPPTIQALLAARLDRLGRAERDAIERAAVVGKLFHRSALASIGGDDGVRLGEALRSLVRKQLVEPAPASFAGDEAFRFRHLLVRDAAYQGIAKETRAALHEGYAGWLEHVAPDRVREFEEILGYHLEQAFRYRYELGPADERARLLAERAGQRLCAAGRRAHARGDARAAVNLLTRAVALLPDEDPLRVATLPELVSALMRAGDFERADAVLAEAMERAVAAGDKRLELRTLIERQFFRMFTDPEGATEELLRVAEGAIPLLEELGDELGLAKAWWLRSEADLIACRWGARAEALERARGHARRAGDAHEEATYTGLLAQALLYGPMPVPEAIARCETFLAEAEGQPALEAAMASSLAALRAMRGDFGEARSLWRRARALYEELGLALRQAARSLVPAGVEMLAGDAAAAERELRWGYETLEVMGERGVRSTIAAFLADLLCQQEHYEEAEHFTVLCEETAASDDLVTQVVWRGTRARLLVRSGEHDAAERRAREAVALAEPTDFLDLQAGALLSLADVLGLAGRAEEAAALVQQAQERYERKGNLVAARRTAALLAPAG